MTVEYVSDVNTATFSATLRLLFRWKGSIYKLLWKDFFIYVVMFYACKTVYLILPPDRKPAFLSIVEYCQRYASTIPVTLVLGFYVAQVVSRFYSQLNSIPWPTRLAVFVNANLRGLDDKSRMMRRAILRYCVLTFVLTMTSICPAVKKRFPTINHITNAGFMLPNEQVIFENIKTRNKWFIPIVWATSLITKARKEGKIKDDIGACLLITEIENFRVGCFNLFQFDFVQIPLVYTQVTAIAVYFFFGSCLFSRQDIEGRSNSVEFVVPFFTFLQYFFYMGWLKVAEELLNPFGEDDDDFEMNTIIDSNINLSYLIVDEMHAEVSELAKDQYWNKMDLDIPYTVGTQASMFKDSDDDTDDEKKYTTNKFEFISETEAQKRTLLNRLTKIVSEVSTKKNAVGATSNRGVEEVKKTNEPKLKSRRDLKTMEEDMEDGASLTKRPKQLTPPSLIHQEELPALPKKLAHRLSKTLGDIRGGK